MRSHWRFINDDMILHCIVAKCKTTLFQGRQTSQTGYVDCINICSIVLNPFSNTTLDINTTNHTFPYVFELLWCELGGPCRLLKEQNRSSNNAVQSWSARGVGDNNDDETLVQLKIRDRRSVGLSVEWHRVVV